MSDNNYYILLPDHSVKAVPLMEWAQWFESASTPGCQTRRVAETIIDGHIRVSTVFLGINYRFSGKGPPIVFETMIFGGIHDQYQERYCTWKQAVKGHEKAVAVAQQGATWWAQILNFFDVCHQHLLRWSNSKMQWIKQLWHQCQKWLIEKWNSL